MEDGLAPKAEEFGIRGRVCLNPCCSGRWSRTHHAQLTHQCPSPVLILVVVEDGLVPLKCQLEKNWKRFCLNPYCSGQWSRTISVLSWTYSGVYVLILIVVDNGLVPMNICKESKKMTLVLILVVVDNGLVHSVK